jgi:sugar lactone lactonase YvrE
MPKLILTIIFLLVVSYFLAWPLPIYPVSWDPVVNPLGVESTKLHIKKLPLTSGVGPEDLAEGPDGRIYTGLANGWVVSLNPDGTDERKHFKTPSRPLGLEFDRDGVLWIADANEGLFRANKSLTGSEIVLSEVDQLKLSFSNDLDVDWLGRVFFTDTSSLPIGQLELDLIENRGRGRLNVYDPKSNQARTFVPGLHFANGVALSKDQDFVLVNETSMHRIKKVNLHTGEISVFIDGLPGFPDNLHRRGDIFWVALIETRSPILDRFAGKPFVRQLIARLPKFVIPYPPRQARVLGINHSGKVLFDLYDSTGKDFHKTSSAIQIGGQLFLGSLGEDGVGVVDLRTQ